MVNLTKIYTRTGDQGTTRLVDNQVAPKTDVRVEAYGQVESANCAIGLALAMGVEGRVAEMLNLIQNELFDVGADLATPLAVDPKWPPLRIEAPSIDRLEEFCDELQDQLPKLKSFILPGGSLAGAQLHVARTQTRTAERAAWRAYEEFGDQPAEHKGAGGVNILAIKYLNRLSDFLFIAARVVNGTDGEVLWQPGTDRVPPKRRGANDQA